ncbi:MAG TPA: SAM-dependent chlorinase/fluorinase [Taishania sp.]|nr:SAM-dependent chlorinase/fluorinase [Taishania sp.]
MRFITLTTDMGLNDYYVATVKASILQRCNSPIHLIDVTHAIKPFDVAEAAFQVSQAYPSFPAGTVHIVGVDAEPIVNFGNSDGAFPSVMEMDGQYFVSNDNGFFGVLHQLVNKAYKFYRVEEILSNPKSIQFPTKNMLVPIAGKIINGENLEDFATPHPHFRRAFLSNPTIEENLIKGSIIHFDNFGNAISNITQELFVEIGKNEPFTLKFREGKSYIIDRISRTYNEVTPGEKLAIFNENGLLEIAINRGANESTGGAEKLFGLRKNDVIRIDFTPQGSKETLHELF